MKEAMRKSAHSSIYYSNNEMDSPPMRLFAHSRSSLLKRSASESKLKMSSHRDEEIKCGSFLVDGSKESSFEKENRFRRSVSDSKQKEKKEYERY